MRLTLLLFVFCAAHAQDFRATLSGTVSDPTGAAIPKARVRIVQRYTNQASQVLTNSEGFYSVNFLNPSTYDVTVEATGFKLYRQEGIELMVSQKMEQNFALTIGSVAEQVTVTESAVDIQTADASGGLNFDALQTSEYPLNGRQVYMLMDLAPGVLFTQEQFGSSGFSGTRGWDTNGSYVMNGGVSGSNSFSLNGAPISLTGSWQVSPNVDAIQEFKVMTNTYDAAIGRTGGGSVNTTLKSGTNRWRGSVADFMRNQIFDANYTQNNLVGAPRGKHITHQFNGVIGGALRKDRDFLFFSFEGFREIVPFPVVANTPPPDLIAGDFTKYGFRIFDPLTGHNCVNTVDVPAICASPIIRDPFPGNTLPASRISEVGKKILSFFPQPNIAGNAITQNFVNSGSVGRYRYDQPMFRIDRVLDQNSRLNGVFTYQHGHEYRNQTGIPGPAASGNINSQRTNLNAIISYTRVLTPALVFDTRLSYGRFTSYFPGADIESGITAADLGMTSVLRAPTSTTNFPPRIIIDQASSLFGNGANLYTWTTSNQWNLAPTFSMVRGSKTIKLGADLVYAGQGTGSIGQANGQLQFTRYGTQQFPLRGGNNRDGSGIADVLLGIPGTGFVDWNDTYYRSWPYFGFFLQTDWKVRKGLTLNLGLRYDVQVPWVERWDRVNAGFDLDSKNPLSDRVLERWRTNKIAYDRNNPAFPYPDPPAALLGGKTFVRNGGPRRTYDTDWQNIQPRIGVAWQFHKRIVLRTGFGIFHRTATQGNFTDGFSQQTPYIRSLDGDYLPSAGATGAYSLRNPFPDGLTRPQGAELGLLANVGNAVAFDGRQRLIPRTFQYSFGFQHRTIWKVLLDVSYVGSQTKNEVSSYNLDGVRMDTFLRGQETPTYLDRTVANPFFGILPPNTTLGAGTTTPARNLLDPFPLFNGITMGTNPWGKYRYDAIQIRADKRFTGNRSQAGALTLVFSYTFSKNFQDVARKNVWNLDEPLSHELVSYDKPQNIAFSGIWDIPFGKRRHFLNGLKGWKQAAIGNWTMNFIYRYTSGNPVAGMNVDRLCPDLLVDGQTRNRWFNNDRSCYRSLPPYTLRAELLRYPWLRQMDNETYNLAASKTFDLTERTALNFRAEAFNLFNHPLFGAPDTGFQNERFGMLPLGQQNFPRLIQVSMKLSF